MCITYVHTHTCAHTLYICGPRLGGQAGSPKGTSCLRAEGDGVGPEHLQAMVGSFSTIAKRQTKPLCKPSES